MDILIPENQLTISDELLARLAEEIPAVNWRGLEEDLKQAYGRYIVLLDGGLRSELGIAALRESIAFYNAYYWVLVFAKRFQERHGFDAGIEQEAFKVLERAPADVDWDVVERVNQAVAGQSGAG